MAPFVNQLRCFNPFKLAKHHKKSVRNLRNINPSLLKKLRPENHPPSADSKVCTSCRVKLSKMPNLSETSDTSSLSENAQPSTSAIRGPYRDGDSTSTEDFVDIQTLNATLLGLGESPINKRKLPQKRYSQDKYQKLQKTLASKVFHVEEETEQEIEGAAESLTLL